jgi:SAM-dependent methyltransferase
VKGKENLARIREEGRKLGLWRHGFGYPQYARQVFGRTELAGKTVLEIGCGNGIYCIWASLQGAKKVVGLEPLVEGSFDSPKCFTHFSEIVKKLNLGDAEMKPLLLQDFRAADNSFDVVLSVASINHLDEKNCINVRTSPEARQAYSTIFGGIGRLMKRGGKLVIVDCSSANLFADLGIRNPFNPSIEWFKHQPPEIWIELLEENGFVNPKVSWTSGGLLRFMGVHSIPKALGYFLASMFRIEMTYRGFVTAK